MRLYNVALRCGGGCLTNVAEFISSYDTHRQYICTTMETGAGWLAKIISLTNYDPVSSTCPYSLVMVFVFFCVFVVVVRLVAVWSRLYTIYDTRVSGHLKKKIYTFLHTV